MARGNLALVVVLMICALSVITAQHRARKLFQALEAEQQRAKTLDEEYGQLQLELSTWAVQPRIERIAAERLKMRVPEPARVVRLAAQPERKVP